MPLTYAIPDLHGRLDLLQKAEQAIAAYSGGTPGSIVMLGDYVDRGPDSRRIIERLMRGADLGWRLVCLRGNHEEIMLLTCQGLEAPERWLENGGGPTLLSYGHPADAALDLGVIPNEHLDWIASLPLMHIDAQRVFVHAGVDPGRPLDAQDPGQLMWKRYDVLDGRGHGHRHVVHGHDPFREGPVRRAGRTGLDTLAWRTGRLVVGVFDDDRPGGPIDVIEVLGEPIE